MDIDRVAEWQEFSKHMENYIQEKTVEKYGIDKGHDLMAITRSPIICAWHMLKYSLRIWNGSMKERDIEKIAHYACFTWVFGKGNIIKNERMSIG